MPPNNQPGGSKDPTPEQQLDKVIDDAVALAKSSIDAYSVHAKKMAGHFAGSQPMDAGALTKEIADTWSALVSDGSKALMLWFDALRLTGKAGTSGP